MMGVVSQKLRDSAGGEKCTVRLECCNYDTDTTVLAHIRMTGDGKGIKPHDWFACFACSDCHDAIDQHRIPKPIRDSILMLALGKTWYRWFEMGLIHIPVTEKRPVVSSKIMRRA